MRCPADSRAAASVFCLATFALVFAALGRAALSVRETPIRPRPADPKHVEQVWTLSAPPEDPAATLDALSISVLGDAFVSFDPSAAAALPDSGAGPFTTVAIVRVVTYSAFSLSSVSVSAAARADGWQQLNVHARLADAVTEVVLTQPRQLQLLRSSGTGDVVVGDRVLFGATSRSGAAQGGVDVAGYGTVFVQLTKPLEGQLAWLNVSGSGDLQIEAPSIQFTSLSVVNSGAASSIAIFADASECATVDVALTQSGDVCWDIARFQTASLAASVSGSGTLTAVGGGSCDVETVDISGSGDAALDAVVCRHVQVTLSGSGDAVVQASDYLGGVVSGSGEVTYSSQEPRYVSDKSGHVAAGASKKVARRSAAAHTAKTCNKHVVPVNKFKRSSVAAAAHPPPLDPGDSDDERDGDVGDGSAQSTADKIWAFVTANVYVVVPASVFIGFWAIALALTRRSAARRRSRDAEQLPLLRKDDDEEEPRVYV